MSLSELINHEQLKKITTHPDENDHIWRADLQRFLAGDATLTRKSAGESGIKAIQRLLVFLGYSTSASGAFAIDGDFGRGTNRAVAQFQVEHKLTRTIARDMLCYPCRWNTARSLIDSIPDARLTPHTLEKMLLDAIERSADGRVVTGDFDDAIFHLNALHKRQYLDCRGILQRYGGYAQSASQQIQAENGLLVRPEWILAIIRQETAGVVRPRFEQHYLSRLHRQRPDTELEELRMQSMSMGLGQIMGNNYKRVGASSASELFTASVARQVAFVGRFLRPKSDVAGKANPVESDFRTIARFYNGPKYEAHHYHEKLARWHREFRFLMG